MLRQRLRPPYASRALCESPPLCHVSMSQRPSQSEGTSRSFGAARSTSRKTLRPTFLTGSMLVFTLELSRLLGRTLCLWKSTVPVRPWRHPDCVAWPSEHVGTHQPTETTSHSRKRRNVSSPKLSVYSARATSAGGLREKPSDDDRLRAVVTKLACIVETNREGSVNIRLVIDLLRSGVNAPAKSTRSALPPVPCYGGAFQQFSSVRVSQCSCPRSSESKRMWTTCVGLSRTASALMCFFGHALAPLGSHGRELVLEKRHSVASVSIGQATITSVSVQVWMEIHQHKAAELLVPMERLSLRDVKEVSHVAGGLRF